MNNTTNSLIEFNKKCIGYIKYIENNLITFDRAQNYLLRDLNRVQDYLLFCEEYTNHYESICFTFEMFKNYFNYHKNSKQHQQAKKYFNRIEDLYNLQPYEQIELAFKYIEERKKPN